LRTNDIVLIEGKNYSSEQFFQQMKDEFDQLYAEGKYQRRMMSISMHDRIGGTPAYVQALDRFIQYAKSHKNVAFKRKDEIARMVLAEDHPLIDLSEEEYNNEDCDHRRCNRHRICHC
jgi:peptidoglycan/xylan/chitin deacetylase (PgdA/CDA1 family)